MESKLSFEQALARLESIVRDLESGNIELEKSLELFEEGISLSSICSQLLKEAKQKVEILVEKNNGEIIKENFIVNE